MSPPILLYRIGNALHRMGIPVLPKLVAWTNRLLFACMIPSSAELGKRVVLGYWALGIVIHKDAKLGDDCWIMQNVTIGRKSGEPGVPRLGKNVAVGAGAVVLGDIEIGDHCVIGANSVVNQSFPARCVVAGVPARLIRELDEGETENHYRER